MTESPAPAATAEHHLMAAAACCLLGAVERLAADARLAGSLRERLVASRLASALVASTDEAVAALTDAGLDVETLMAGFIDPVDDLGARARPQTWPEAVLKVHLTEGVAHDLLTMTSSRIPDMTRGLLHTLDAQVDNLRWFCEQELAEAIGAARDTSTLSLFGRRVVGECVAQVQRAAGRHAQVTSLLTGASEGSMDDLAATTSLLADLVELSAQRLVALGLQP